MENSTNQTESQVNLLKFKNNVFMYSTQDIQIRVDYENPNDEISEQIPTNLSKNVNYMFVRRKEFAKLYLNIKNEENRDLIVENIQLCNDNIKSLLGL